MKQIVFQPMGCNCFNLAFGDWMDDVATVNDNARSNNLDRDKVLATVATVVQQFLLRFLSAKIFVSGSTTSRTRLYQIQLLARLQEINSAYLLDGYSYDGWEPFQPNRNYDSFSITTKIKKHEEMQQNH